MASHQIANVTANGVCAFKRNNDTQILRQQIDILKLTIQREEEKTSELELKSRIFSYGEYRADKQVCTLVVVMSSDGG